MKLDLIGAFVSLRIGQEKQNISDNGLIQLVRMFLINPQAKHYSTLAKQNLIETLLPVQYFSLVPILFLIKFSNKLNDGTFSCYIFLATCVLSLLMCLYESFGVA